MTRARFISNPEAKRLLALAREEGINPIRVRFGKDGSLEITAAPPRPVDGGAPLDLRVIAPDAAGGAAANDPNPTVAPSDALQAWEDDVASPRRV